MEARRNKEETKEKLIKAAGRLIRDQGFHNLGVNAVAREAGVDKVLIYRYFKSLDGLLEAYLKKSDYWMKSGHFSEIDLSMRDFNFLRTLMKEIFIGQLQDLKENDEMQEFMKWELIATNEITRMAAREREKTGTEIMENYMKVLNEKDMDLPAITGILIAGIYYLVLRSKTADVFNTIPLDNPKGWQRIENGISQFIDLLFEKMENKSKKP